MSAAALALFLEAVALVETGGDARKVGRAGERGAFQMTPAVVASCGGYGAKEAAHYARWLELQLVHGGIDPLPYNLALAWNAGPGAVRRGTATMASYDYALRVKNTYEALLAGNNTPAAAVGSGPQIRRISLGR